jgi:hypothetical protein
MPEWRCATARWRLARCVAVRWPCIRFRGATVRARSQLAHGGFLPAGLRAAPVSAWIPGGLDPSTCS